MTPIKPGEIQIRPFYHRLKIKTLVWVARLFGWRVFYDFGATSERIVLEREALCHFNESSLRWEVFGVEQRFFVSLTAR